MNEKEFLQAFSSGRQDFSNTDLSDLTINNIDFYQYNLKGCNFKNSKLVQCYFVGSDLSNCDFIDAELKDVLFQYSSLPNTNFEDTYLDRTILSNSLLSSSDWDNTTSIASDFKHNNFCNANFNLAKFQASCFNNNDLLHVDLSNCIFSGMESKGSNLILTNSLKHPKDLKLIDTLKQESHIEWFDTIGNKVSYFLWTIPNQQEITIENILEWGKYPINTLYEGDRLQEHFYHSLFVNRDSEFNNIEPFENGLTDIMVYVLGIDCTKTTNTVSPDIFQACFGADIYVIGKTPSGNFAGCATEVSWE